jgi:hypothetical protein
VPPPVPLLLTVPLLGVVAVVSESLLPPDVLVVVVVPAETLLPLELCVVVVVVVVAGGIGDVVVVVVVPFARHDVRSELTPFSHAIIPRSAVYVLSV